MSMPPTLATKNPDPPREFGPPTRSIDRNGPFWSLRGTAVGLMVFVVVWRIVLFGLAYFSRRTVAPYPRDASWQATRTGLEIWNQWDASYFLSIAAEGYLRAETPAFFPLFPLFIKVVRTLSGGLLGLTASALLVNLVLTGVLVLLLWRLAHLFFGPESANRAVLYLLLFPTAVFLAAPYSEATFLVTVVGSFYAAQKKNWLLAGAIGSLAALSRPTGIVMFPVLLLLYLEQNRFRLRNLGFGWMWAGLVPLGTLGYFFWLERVGRGFFGYFTTIKTYWPSRRFSLQMSPFDEVLKALTGEEVWGQFTPVADMIAIMGAIVLTIIGWKLLPKAYALYTSLLILSILVSDTTTGASRYVLGMFPCLLILASFGRRHWVDRAIITAFAPALGLFTAMYSLGYWVG